MNGEQDVTQDIGDFFGDVPLAKARGGAKRKLPEVAPPEGSLAEAEAEGRKLREREERRAARLARTERIRPVGPRPEGPSGPTCHFCGDPRRLSPELVEVEERGDVRRVRLCRFCASVYEEDRARRCLACGEASSRRLLHGLCVSCAQSGRPLVNLIRLVKLRWIGVIKGD